MKTIALLHTVSSVLLSFGDRLRESITEELTLHNTLDEFLASDANVHGFTKNNLNRLRGILEAMDREGADLLVVTCSTLTPWVEKLRPLLETPVICIDDAMTKQAVAMGTKICVMATAGSTVEATKAKLQLDAAYADREIQLEQLVCAEAFDAIRHMDKERHDQLLRQAAQSKKGQDVVVLAQASMAHMEEEIQGICGCPVLSSPRLCVEQVKETLQALP